MEDEPRILRVSVHVRLASWSRVLMESREAELAASKPKGGPPELQHQHHRHPPSPTLLLPPIAVLVSRSTIISFHSLALSTAPARRPTRTPTNVRHHVRWPAEAREGLHQGRRQADPGS